MGIKYLCMNQHAVNCQLNALEPDMAASFITQITGRVVDQKL